MSEILDEFEVKDESKKKGYLNLISFFNGIALIATMVFFTRYLEPTVEAGFVQPPLFIVFLFLGLLFSGLIFTFFSFRRNGKFVVLKWLGAIINLFFFIVIIGSMLFALYIDLHR